ncbi:MAG: trypsin-like peptidase domain-containing protein [Defluviitaleaceae bacterium]|nr:trypsin-like peptidase domain-containing protein [Defluviitaleaceae bacterium]
MDEYGNLPDKMDENIEKSNGDEQEIIIETSVEIEAEPEPETEAEPTVISYRKSGPVPPIATMPVIVPPYTTASTTAYVPDPSLYEETREEAIQRRKENRSFYRFIASVLIFAMVGAPFLGLGFGLGVRLFDSYFLPILMDDTEERQNFSFDNISAPIINPQFQSGRPSYVELVQLVEPSVVLISAELPASVRNSFNFNFGGPMMAGSGIIMYETSTRYYIATNAHVIQGADHVHVSIAGSEKIPAIPVGRDDDADLAVIAVNRSDALQQGVTSVRIASFGDSSLMQVGEAVLAIGNSMGEGNTVTNGIISAIDRQIFVSDRHLPEVLQTNAAINQGNSGGPLINLYGEVIGINTAKFSERLAEGMGYAIPSNIAMPILERIMHEHDTLSDERPMIGIRFVAIDSAIADSLTQIYINRGANEEDLIIPSQGLMISSVFPSSPAERAGLVMHDIITHVNGTLMTADYQIIDIFATLSVGDSVSLTIVRDGLETLTINIVLGPHISTF